MPSNACENFRTVLVMNLCSVLSADQLPDVLRAVDITLDDFEITRKPLQIICSEGIPEVAKLYIASKAISGLSQGTLKQYSYRISDFFSSVRKPYTDIQSNDIRMYLYRCKAERNASDHYLDNIRRILKTFFQWLVDNEYLTRNPCATVDHIKYQEKPREPFSDYQLEFLRWNCRTVREKALVDFLYSTGCRASECAEVRLSDISWKDRSVVIRHGKGNKRRITFFNAESELSLRMYLETRSDDSDYLFVTARRPYRNLCIRSIEAMLKKIGARCDLRCYPHRFRHTFATSGLRSGMPLEQLQSLMGHADPQTTLIYAKLDSSDLRSAHHRAYA